MGKHSKHASVKGLSYREARQRRKDLRSRSKPQKGKGSSKWSFFVVIFLCAVVVGGVLGYFAKPLGKAVARWYVSMKEKDWQITGKEKKEVEKSLTTVSKDPNKSVNTLILGSDTGSNKGEKGWCRSDVMMLVCLKEKDKKAVVISIPRDTKIQLAGYGTEKINAAHSYGGPSAAIDVVKQMLGVDVNHYISLNFEGFKQIINQIGGVPIHLSKPINDPHAGYLPAGDLLLDGEQALVVVRSRKLPGGDVDRIKSQQAFLKGLFNKLSTMKSALEAKKIFDILASTCKMDYSADEVMTLVEELKNFPLQNVQFVTVPGGGKYINGGSYYVINDSQLAQVMSEVRTNNWVSPELLAQLQVEGNPGGVEQLYDPTADVVKVLSSSRSTDGATAVVAEELRLLGHENVSEGQTKNNNLPPQTVLYCRTAAKDRAEAIKKSIPELANAQVSPNEQVAANYNSPVVLVIGSGFATPNLTATYGRLLQPAIDFKNLGKKIKPLG